MCELVEEENKKTALKFYDLHINHIKDDWLNDPKAVGKNYDIAGVYEIDVKNLGLDQLEMKNKIIKLQKWNMTTMGKLQECMQTKMSILKGWMWQMWTFSAIKNPKSGSWIVWAPHWRKYWCCNTTIDTNPLNWRGCRHYTKN